MITRTFDSDQVQDPTISSTTSRTTPQMQVIARMSPRRRWSTDEKRAMVEATYDPGTTVAEVAECFEVSPAQLYSWRRQVAEGTLDQRRSVRPSFAQVELSSQEQPLALPPPTSAPGLPHYRQAEMMAAQGIDIDRSTLARWSGQAASLLDPIVSRIREEGLKASKIHTDDTPVPMLDPGRGKTATGRLWTYVVDDRNAGSATPPLVWYRFTPIRSGSHPAQELASFNGFLQADAYSGYDQLYRTNRIIEVGCWGHFRRKIFDLHEAKQTPLTTNLLRRIAALYQVEESVRGQPPDVRLAARRSRTRPLIDDLRQALLDAFRRLSPKSEMAKAIAYGTKHWASLTISRRW